MFPEMIYIANNLDNIAAKYYVFNRAHITYFNYCIANKTLSIHTGSGSPVNFSFDNEVELQEIISNLLHGLK